MSSLKDVSNALEHIENEKLSRLPINNSSRGELLHDIRDYQISLRYWRNRAPRKSVLIILDSTDCEYVDNFNQAVMRARQVMDSIQIFSEIEDCLEFLTNIEFGLLFLIVSDQITESAISALADITPVEATYIFVHDKAHEELYNLKYPDVDGINTDISVIVDNLIEYMKLHKQNKEVDSLFGLNSDLDIDKVDQSFMYTTLLQEILLEMDYDELAKKSFFQFLRDKISVDSEQMQTVDRIEKNYDQHSPIWWYTSEPLIFSSINQALRAQDVACIIKMGFYMKELHQQIEQTYKKSGVLNRSVLYRGQCMCNEEFENIRDNVGGLVVFNSFLSTSKNIEIATHFMNCDHDPDNLRKILFEITIDPETFNSPFADLIHVRDCETILNEVIFSMNTIFRIMEVKEKDFIWNVQLTITSNTDSRLELLTHRIRQEISGKNVTYRLANLLLRMGKYDTALEYYNYLLEIEHDNAIADRAFLFNQMGRALSEKGDLIASVNSIHRAISIQLTTVSNKNSDLSSYYMNMAAVYEKMGEYSNALNYCEKALQIQTENVMIDHPNLAKVYVNLGSLHDATGNYMKALHFYESAVDIQLKILPAYHPDLSNTYSCIGSVYNNMGDYSKALSYHEKALDIRKRTLPPMHPLLASGYNSVGCLYQHMGDYSTARRYFEKTLKIQEAILHENHFELAVTYTSLGCLCDSCGEYSTALSYLQRSLTIQQKVLPDNHPHLANNYNAVGLVYLSMGQYNDALAYFRLTEQIHKKTLQENHPSFGEVYNNIGSVYQNMGHYVEALSYYEKTLEIRRNTMAMNHPDLATTYNNLGLVYDKLGEYSKALRCFEKTLGIQENSLPGNHPMLASMYSNMGRLHISTRNYTKAISFYKKTLAIQKISLPKHHPSLAATYNEIGRAHALLQHFGYAIDYFQEALKIQKSLKENHPAISETYLNIANMYESTGDLANALSYYERSLAIQEKFLPSNHPSLANTYTSLATAYHSMEFPTKALSLLNKALEIQRDVLPSNHPSLARTEYTLSIVLANLNQHNDAIEHAKQALKIIIQSEISDICVKEKYQNHVDSLRMSMKNYKIKGKGNKLHLPTYFIGDIEKSPTIENFIRGLDVNQYWTDANVDSCIEYIKSNAQINSVFFRMGDIDHTQYVEKLEKIHDIEQVESIYLLGKPPEDKIESKKIFKKFGKIVIFTNNEDRVAIRWIMSILEHFRSIGLQYKDRRDREKTELYIDKAIYCTEFLKKFLLYTRVH